MLLIGRKSNENTSYTLLACYIGGDVASGVSDGVLIGNTRSTKGTALIYHGYFVI
jgi:hypothetical protein